MGQYTFIALNILNSASHIPTLNQLLLGILAGLNSTNIVVE